MNRTQRTFSLRALFVAAAALLVLLPVVALVGGLAGVAALNWPAIAAAPEEIDAVERAVTAVVVDRWASLETDRAGFEGALENLHRRPGADVPERLSFRLEVRDLTDRVRYASPGVVDGEYHAGGFQAVPNQRVVLLRRGDQPLGVLVLWITPVGALGGLGRAMAAGLWAAAGAMVAVLLLALWAIRRMVLRPLEALEVATDRVAAGDLDFAVPEARVRELASLSAGFAAMRDRLKASLERQRRLEEERRQFIAAIGHDLRTPLSSMRAFAEGLRDGLAREPEKARRYGQVILNKTREVERLVEDLFEYARLGLPGMRLERQRVDSAEYLRAIARSFEPRAEEAGITLAAEGPSLPLEVDPDLLARALGNLLSNAVRHTPAGGRIDLTWAPAPDGGVAIAVTDTGEGIPPEEQPHLFTPLHRTDRSRSRRTGGAGLGLAITAQVAALHGGRVTCESQPGQGSRFTLWLPAGDER